MNRTIPSNWVGAAEFSECRRYRYALGRTWDHSKPSILFIMLNPSTADQNTNDPSVAKCCYYARTWDFGSAWVANLFALRATFPTDLYRSVDPVEASTEPGRNDATITRLASQTHKIVLAWGNDGSYLQRAQNVTWLLKGYRLFALRITKQGQPWHPLYLPNATTPTRYAR